jgi:radical SAM protein with 4Fe4S-binding SPASM domain
MQLAEVGFRGIFNFSGFVEPLLDKKIYSHITCVRSNLPRSKIELVTNGDVLNKEKIRKLFDAGLSTLLISVYDGPEDADRFQKMCDDSNIDDNQFVIRHRYLPPEKDFGITLSNRAGMMANAQFMIPAKQSRSDAPCYYPHYTFFFDYLGDVLLCPHDWGRKLVVGNLNKQSFLDIWLGDKMTHARQSLVQGQRIFEPCNLCDVKGTLVGKCHVSAWKNFYESPDCQQL